MERMVLIIMVMCCIFCMRRLEASHVLYDLVDSSISSFRNGEYRTGYHFHPPMNWLNDPNGPMYYKGFYHLFYQYNPQGAKWGNIVWAHSVSPDMVNWHSLPPALYPSEPFDIMGCWSGSATILPGNKPVILYTGVLDSSMTEVQNIAIPKNLSDPFLREWTKPSYNPVIKADVSVNASAFRDPTTAWLGPDGHWRILIGGRRPGKNRGMALLYRSKDFVHWVKAKHLLHSENDSGMWECPDFFPVALEGTHGLDTSKYGAGTKHVLKLSLDVTRYDYYTVGKYIHNEDRYVPDDTSADNNTGLRYDYGNFYASKTFFDPAKNRRILWGWSNESDRVEDDVSKGWAGIQTIPRSLWLHKSGRQIVQWPIGDIETLRGKETQISDTNIESGSIVQVKGILTSQADVEVTFHVPNLEMAEPFDPKWTDPQVLCGLKGAEVNGGIGPFGLFVLASGDLAEKTAVFFRVFKGRMHKHVVLMCHDSSKSSMRPEVWKQSFGSFIDYDIETERKISLRSLIDNSVVESFGAGGSSVITSRIYPVIAIDRDAYLFAFNNGVADVIIRNLTAWEMTKPFMNGVNNVIF